MKPPFLYQDLEMRLRDEIETGQRSAGQRMPSVRNLCQSLSVSKSTVLMAYARLEADGLIVARPRSGYFVALDDLPASKLTSPATSCPSSQPIPVSANQVLQDIMQRGAAFDLLPPAPNTGNPSHPGNAELRRCLGRAIRQQRQTTQSYYDAPQGDPVLRGLLAQRMGQGGGLHKGDDLVVTAGCQHALLLALMATTTAGDVVAVESPGFYGVFQLLEALGLQALEIPSSATTGLSPEALQMALQHWPVTALVVSPAFSTPTGARMPDRHKQQVLALAEQYDLAVIEDDIYGELHFDVQRPRTLYSFDAGRQGRVLLCSSFSKSLSRDIRLGWIAPGRYFEAVKHLKLVTNLASSQSLQRGVSHYLQQGAFDRYLRQRRQQLKLQCVQWQQAIPDLVPAALSCSVPQGGLSFWLELAQGFDMLALYGKAREQQITLTPGRLFTAQERYQSFLRISFEQPLDEPRRQCLQRLQQLLTQSQV